MNLVFPHGDRIVILKECKVVESSINIENATVPVNVMGPPPQMVFAGRTIRASMTILAKDMDTTSDEDFEIASIKEKTVRECSLGELILAIAGKS